MNINLPNQVQFILNTIHRQGFEAFVVGGSVRDSLLNRQIHDYDITTDALSHDLMEIFKGYYIMETGIKHGTVTVIIDHMPIEITTYRIDGEYSDNRRPDKVTFTKSLKEDLKRRDFTINALAYNEKTGLIDYFNGIKDLDERIISTVGNPDDRFKEDSLRILRALRLASVLEFHIDPRVKISIHKYKGNLHNIAVERISAELIKILLGKGVYLAIVEFQDVLNLIIPELKRLDKNSYIRTCKIISQIKSEKHLRLSGLLLYLYSSEEEILNILKNIKIDNLTIKKITKLLSQMEKPIRDKIGLKWCLNSIGEDLFRDLLYLKEVKEVGSRKWKVEDKVENDLCILPDAEASQIHKLLDEIIKNNEAYTIRQLKVNGEDFIKLGYPRGKLIGQALDYLLQEVIEERVANTREELLHLLKKEYRHN